MEFLPYIVAALVIISLFVLPAASLKLFTAKVLGRPVAFWRCLCLSAVLYIGIVVIAFITARLIQVSYATEVVILISGSVALLVAGIYIILPIRNLKQVVALAGFHIFVSLLVLGVYIFFRTSVVSPFIITGGAMEPAYDSGQFVLVDYVSDEYAYGDVIVFRYPRDPSRYFVMRIIGVPGDTVEVRENSVKIIDKQYPRGLVLIEPYAFGSNGRPLTEVLGEGEYFVMGDNRETSSDSRSWGVLRIDKIVGKVIPQQ